MRNKKRILPLLEKLTVVDTAAEGKAVARYNDIVVFITHAVPGDVVDVQVTHKKKQFMEGKAIHYHKLSEMRAEPFCEHFGVCGGCKWQNMDYKNQLHFKHKQVEDALNRLTKIELPAANPILPSKETKYYRNKLEYTFSNKRWLERIDDNNEDKELNGLGFHVPGRFDKVLDINNCYLQPEPSNSLRNELRKYALENSVSFYDIREQHGYLRNFIIRTSTTGDVMVILSVFEDKPEILNPLMDHLINNFSMITSWMYVINGKKNDVITDLEIKLYKGEPFITEQMEGIKFRIGPKSFYQTNSIQAYELYKITRDFAGLSGNEIVYDLYTGTGTIANFVAGKSKKVVGIEYIEAAIIDAKTNSTLNNISNTSFYAGDMKDVLTHDFIAANGQPDIIITDPPRAGMHADVVQRINESNAKKVVYVSCNPATQARDLQLMDEFYKVVKIQPVDMFPHTHHVENVVLLERR